jgi:hypothetical protein
LDRVEELNEVANCLNPPKKEKIKMRPPTRDAIDLYVAKGVDPGGFLFAVLTNNLMEAFALADDDNQKNIIDVLRYIWNHTPALCWGNVDTVKEWIKHDGLAGYKVKKGTKTNGKTKGKGTGSKS